VYPALHELERAGLLASRWVEAPNVLKRKYYRLTPKGERHLKTAREEWGVFSSALNKMYQGI
jgi:DNA-binding PadR family transcriptional regulator